MNYLKLLPMLALPLLAACSDDDGFEKDEPDAPGEPGLTSRVAGFYLLNDGNLGTNTASLDFYDYATGQLEANVYAAANPTVVKELGDAGNDLQIYGSRLWAVVNGSNKVEVMDAKTCRRLGQVDIANPRYVAFDGKYAYVTSYAGNIELTPDYSQRGYLAQVDTATLQVTARCEVGFQPDGVAVCGGKAYVANSGGYMAPNYETTLSVIDVPSMTLAGTVEIAPNLQYVLPDGRGNLWVSSRGNYADVPAAVYCYNIADGKVPFSLPVTVGAWWLDDGTIYTVGQVYDKDWNASNSYVAISVDGGAMRDFVGPEVKSAIQTAYGVAVNPATGDILLTDAGNFVNPGFLWCLNPDGTKKWSLRAGDIPAQIAFLK